MPAQSFGPRRSRATTKPQADCPQPVFHRCGVCGAVVLSLAAEETSSLACCGQTMELLKARPAEELPPGMALDYQIVGGPNDNAVRVSWLGRSPGERPEWLYLKTFTGGYLRRLAPDKRAPVVFPLADEDAYVYCDKDPCVECTFRCKRGFALYGWFDGAGLVTLPLDRMSAPR